MKILSYITEKNQASKNLKDTLCTQGYDYKFLGLGQEWKGFVQGKIKTLFLYLCTAPDDIYCVIDGYDVFANNSPAKLEKLYRSFCCPIVFGGEKFCFSYNGTPLDIYRNLSVWNYRKYLNGGICIGERKSLVDMYDWILQESERSGIQDDQKLFGLYANKFPGKISVDITQKIAFNSITELDIANFHKGSKKRVFCTPYMNIPCFLHFPSSSSDGHSRYNLCGKILLGNKFRSLIGERSWNIFANIPFYSLCMIVFIYFFRIKFVILLSFIVWKKIHI